MQKFFIFSSYFIFTIFCYSEEQVQILANDIIIEDNQFKTTDGAVIIYNDIRIQAKNICYYKNTKSKPKIHKIEASQDLMIAYEGYIFIADNIDYDFTSNTGLIKNGITYDNFWFIFGDLIKINSDGSITIDQGTITTSEKPNTEFALKAKKITLKKDHFLKAKHLQVTYTNIPIFYFPYFYTSLEPKNDTKIRYKATWESGQGPKLSMRYEAFSNKNLDLFTRLDIRPKRGLAGAIESDFHALNSDLFFKTKNYLAHDTFFNDFNPNKKKTRYRLQGIAKSMSSDTNWKTFFRYDKYSDPNMPLDFDGDDFELNTALKTEAIINHQNNWLDSSFYLRPKINSFQSFKQDLPTITFCTKPLIFETTGLTLESYANFSYLNYQYNEKLLTPPPSFESGKIEIKETISQPIDWSIFKIVPQFGYHGIFYSNSPNNYSNFDNLLSYGFDINTTLRKKTSDFLHLMKPYIQFYATNPIHLGSHYIFSYEDGFNQYKFLKLGFRHYSNKKDQKYDFNFFGYHFFNQNNFNLFLPKLGIEFDFYQNYIDFYSKFLYDTEHKSFDRAQIGLKWTIASDLAFRTEFKHRGKYGFRKVNFEDYTLDINQNTNTLLNSPISETKNTANFSFQWNPSRSTILKYESNIGWNQKNYPFYHEFKIDLFHLIATNWKLRISYLHLVNDDQLSLGLNIIPNL